jgi:DNA replication licensing factor MCM7
MSDVDEALRLIKAAKSSLNDQSSNTNRDLSRASQIFEIIRSLQSSATDNAVAIEDIRRRVIARGYTEDEMWSTIKEYDEYGVWFTNVENTRLTFVEVDDMSDMDID